MSRSNLSDKSAPLAIVLIVAVIGIVYLSIKAYVYFSTSSKLDDAIKQASLFAEIEYDGIASDLLDGRITVQDIRIMPRTINDVVSIREVSIAGDGPGFLFTDFAAIGVQPPESMHFAMRGLRFSLDGEIMKSINNLSRDAMRQRIGSVPGSCDFGGSMAPADLRALGFDALESDISMYIAADPRSQTADIAMDIDVVDMADMSFDASIKVDPTAPASMKAPSFSSLNITYAADAEYMRGVRKYCARITGLSEEQYVDSVVEASDADYQRYYGFVPGVAMRDAAKRFLLNPDVVEISMRPSQTIKPEMLQLYKFDDLVEMLGLTVKVNQQPLADFSIRLGDQASQLFGQSQSGDKQSQQEELQVVYAFQDTDVKRLPQYIGAQVKITTRDGKQREGALVSINQKTAQIEQRIHSGKFAAHVELNDIQHLQVHRRVRDAKP
ncbi:MAG: hypothetical protein PVG66_08685 [Chromatiales bacterium]|jgi:hypothetical protein